MTNGGSLIRDHSGLWIKVFTQNIGVTTNVDAELWVTRDGLTSCINLYISEVEIDIDAKVVPG